jgi:hypothetical protein
MRCIRDLLAKRCALCRLDAGVSTACAKDIDDKCAAEKSAAHGKSEVLKCLVRSIYIPNLTVDSDCETEVSRCATTHLPRKRAIGITKVQYEPGHM